MEMKHLLKRLVETESPSSDKAAVDRVGALVAEEAHKIGAQVEIVPNDETGNHVLARFALSGARAVEAKGEGGLLLLCHMDTVFPLGALDRIPFREADGKMFGPGVLDMKSGIVIALAALEELYRSNAIKRPVNLLCTSDEEIGSHTSRALIESLAKESAMIFVLESGLVNGALKTWRKGVGDFTVKVKGRAAHAGGEHEKGRNAIEEMAHQVIAIQKLTDYSRGTTLNVGQIRGGFAANAVPDECVVKVDLRVLNPDEAPRIEAALKNLRPVLDGTSIEVTGELNRPPMPYNKVNQAAFKKAFDIARDALGIELEAGGSGGGSDANFVAPLGVPVLDGLGAIGEGYHSEREFIFADSLQQRRDLLAALIQNW